MIATVKPLESGPSQGHGRLQLVVAYPESFGNLDTELEDIVGRPCAGSGSNGETPDLDWSFEPAEIEQAESALLRLRADERFTARSIELSDE